jgi:hypothetical protein
MSQARHAAHTTRSRKRNVTRGVVLLMAVAATTTVGVGLASWSATGVSVSGGETPGTSASKQGLTITTTAPLGMFPTQTSVGNVVGTVTNPNSYNVTLSSASVTGVTGCTGIALTDFTFGAAVITTAVATKSGGAPAVVTIPITAVNNTLPDACAASPIKFDVTANGASS